jgi:hypothetical protein
MYICRHFKIYELVDEKTFDRYGLRAWEFFNPQALRALDNLREFFAAPVTVNNYHSGGPFHFRGLRPRSCGNGAELSQHIRTLDNLREFFGAQVTVNNGAEFSQHIRALDNLREFFGAQVKVNVGAEFSQHRLGNAFDCDIKGVPAEQARQVILDQPDHPQFALINCIEGNVNWLHFDCRNIPDRIRIVYP